MWTLHLWFISCHLYSYWVTISVFSYETAVNLPLTFPLLSWFLSVIVNDFSNTMSSVKVCSNCVFQQHLGSLAWAQCTQMLCAGMKLPAKGRKKWAAGPYPLYLSHACSPTLPLCHKLFTTLQEPQGSLFNVQVSDQVYLICSRTLNNHTTNRMFMKINTLPGGELFAIF